MKNHKISFLCLEFPLIVTRVRNDQEPLLVIEYRYIWLILFVGKKSSNDESDGEPAKKKPKVDEMPPPSELGHRLSDQTINDYLDRRKTSFYSSYCFSTFYYESFEDGGRSAAWSLPYLFDYKRLIIPIFQRQK